MILRGSVAHGDQRFEVPVLLSKDPDLQTILLAYVAPPLLCYSLNRFIVRPLWRRHRLAKVLSFLSTSHLIRLHLMLNTGI